MHVGTFSPGSREVSDASDWRLGIWIDSQILDAKVAVELLRNEGWEPSRNPSPVLEHKAFEAAWLTPEGLDLLRELVERWASASKSLRAGKEALVYDPSEVTYGCPVPRPGKILAVGRNYVSHLIEGQRVWAERGKSVESSAFPTGFVKVPSALTPHESEVLLPVDVDDVDYEIELCAVIGRYAKDVSVDEALTYIAGYSIFNDISARSIQLAEMASVSIVLGKNFETFAPTGPVLVTTDEIPDPQDLDLTLSVNGEIRQKAHTSDMLFSVAQVVSHWSRMGLHPGDTISTGTPGGVALGMQPDPTPYYLREGDVVEASISRIGTLRNVMKQTSQGAPSTSQN